MATIAGNVTTIGDIDDWIICAFHAGTHAYAGSAAVVAGSYSISGLTAGVPYILVGRPAVYAWSASRKTAIGDYVLATDPPDAPYYYEATAYATPNYANIQLLMHLDGANNGTVFTDETGRTITRIGSAVTSTAQSKFGGASLLVGNNNGLSTPSDAGFAFGSGDFTLEAFIYRTGTASGAQYVVSRYDTNSKRIFGLLLAADYTPLGLASSTGTSADIAVGSTTPLSINTWYHIAFERDGTTFRLYVDGVVVGSATSSASLYENSSVAVTIGCSTNGFYFPGHIDELQMANAAMYQGAFTAPSAPFLYNVTGSTEPTWVTDLDDTVTDGAIIWTNRGGLIRPLANGPLLAA